MNTKSSRRVARAGLAATIVLVLWPALRAGEAAPSVAAAPPTRIRVLVDPRVELLSVIFHLAGNREYNQGRIPSYVKDVDEYFGPFKKHAAVVRARKLARERGVACDAPMMLAVCLTDIPSVQMRACHDPFPLQRDPRWTRRDVEALLKDLQSFVRATDFAAFIERHQPLYRTACDRLEQVLRDRQLPDWLDRFFGPRPQGEFIVAIGMLNGGPSYGPALQLADGRQEIYAVLGAWSADDAGLPRFDAGMVSVIVHEFVHTYVRPLVTEHAKALRPAGEKILSRVKPEMRGQGYGEWATVMTEALVRACTVRYVLALDGTAAADAEVKYNAGRMFLWTGGLADLLAEYETSRQTYPTLDVFMPRILRFFDDYAAEHLEKDIAAHREQERLRREALQAQSPKIVSLVPPNGAEDVDPALPAVVITFDRPMVKGNLAFMRRPEAQPLPAVGAVGFDETGQILTIPVKLQPKTRYGFGLNADDVLTMQDQQGHPLAPVVIRFQTRAAR
jgi:hypothetical protein